MFSLINSCPKLMYRLIRISLYVFTFSLSLSGLGLIIFSFWYMHEGNQYHLETTTSFSVTAILFIIGVVLLGVSSCGLAGVLRENLFLSKMFLCSSVLLMIIELVSVILIYVYKKQILENANLIFESFIVNYVDDDDVRTVVDAIQSNLHCCGITSVRDWEENAYYSCDSISTLACSVPSSCCKNYKYNAVDNNFFCGVGIRNNSTMKMDSSNKVYLNGCKFEIYSFFERKHSIIFTVISTSILPQLMGILSIICYMMLLNWFKKGHGKLGQLNAIEINCTVQPALMPIGKNYFNPGNNYFQGRVFNEINYY